MPLVQQETQVQQGRREIRARLDSLEPQEILVQQDKQVKLDRLVLLVKKEPREIRVLMERLGTPELLAHKETQETLALQETLEPLVRRVAKEIVELLVQQVILVLQDRLVKPVRQETPVQPDRRETKGILVLMVQQALQEPLAHKETLVTLVTQEQLETLVLLD